MKKSINNIAATNIMWNKGIDPYTYYNESGTEDKHKTERTGAVDMANHIVSLLRREVSGGYDRLQWQDMPRVADIKTDVKHYLYKAIERYVNEHVDTDIKQWSVVDPTINLNYDKEYITSLVCHIICNDYLPRTNWAICNHPCIVKDVA